jgi:hypothetical protein
MPAIDALSPKVGVIASKNTLDPVPKLWRVSAMIFAPVAFEPAPDGGLPEQLKFQSRLPDQSRMYGGTPVAIQPAPEAFVKQFEGNPHVVPKLLSLDIAALTGQIAVERAGLVVEPIIDLMSFDMAAPLVVGQVDFTDITPPIAVGDERETGFFAAAPFSPYERGTEMEAIQGRLSGQLPESIEIGDSKVAAALRWFVKALSTDLRHDQFIFLWIALEILSDLSEVKVLAPYVGPCQHEITNCPECNRETSRLVRGATMRAFLEIYGVGNAEAKKLWAMRQLMHGAIPFDSKKLEELASLVQVLRAAVNSALKERLGVSANDPPIVAPSGLSIHPGLGGSGTGQVTEDDVLPLVPPA